MFETSWEISNLINLSSQTEKVKGTVTVWLQDVVTAAMSVPLLYLRKMAMVRGQILFSALVVKAGSTVQTMHSVSMTRVSTSELNWAASCTSPSRMLGRKG